MSSAGTNLWDAQQTVDSIIEDFPQSKVASLHKPTASLQLHLSKQAAVVVDFDRFSRIDQHEVNLGQTVGKPREKIVDLQKMLQLVQ